MKKIILATGNPGKVRELNAMLNGHYSVVSQKDLQVKEIPETGSSFIENALIKARNASLQTKLPALADDSGLEVEVLDGEPGIYSARYAREGATDEENVKMLLLNMDGHNNRKAHFCCAMVYINDEKDDEKNMYVSLEYMKDKLRQKFTTDRTFSNAITKIKKNIN